MLPPYGELNGKPCPPSQSQAEFHRVVRSGVRHVYFRAGLGAGKSWAGAWAFLREILSNRAKLQASGRSGVLTYAVGAPSYQLLDAGAWTHLINLLDSINRINGISLIRGKPLKTHPRSIQLRTNDRIVFISTDVFKYHGASLAGVWLDEAEVSENPAAAFQLMRRRLRDSRSPHLFYLVTSTPTVSGEGVSAIFEDEDQSVFRIVEGSTKDNPGIDADYYNQLRAHMSEAEAASMLEGKPQPPSGTIFAREFCRQKSIDWSFKFDGPRGNRNTEIILCTDWGGHYYTGFVQHDLDTGIDVLFDEVISDNVQDVEHLERVCDRLRSKWGLSRRDVARFYCDAQPHTAVRLAYSPRYFPGRVLKRRMTEQIKRSGIEAVKHRLRDADGHRRFFLAPALVHEKSRGMYRSLQAYSYKKRMLQGRETYTSRVNQDAWPSHAVDALRYYIGYRYRFQTIREKVVGSKQREAT